MRSRRGAFDQASVPEPGKRRSPAMNAVPGRGMRAVAPCLGRAPNSSRLHHAPAGFSAPTLRERSGAGRGDVPHALDFLEIPAGMVPSCHSRAISLAALMRLRISALLALLM